MNYSDKNSCRVIVVCAEINVQKLMNYINIIIINVFKRSNKNHRWRRYKYLNINLQVGLWRITAVTIQAKIWKQFRFGHEHLSKFVCNTVINLLLKLGNWTSAIIKMFVVVLTLGVSCSIFLSQFKKERTILGINLLICLLKIFRADLSVVTRGYCTWNYIRDVKRVKIKIVLFIEELRCGYCGRSRKFNALYKYRDVCCYGWTTSNDMQRI